MPYTNSSVYNYTNYKPYNYDYYYYYLYYYYYYLYMSPDSIQDSQDDITFIEEQTDDIPTIPKNEVSTEIIQELPLSVNHKSDSSSQSGLYAIRTADSVSEYEKNNLILLNNISNKLLGFTPSYNNTVFSAQENGIYLIRYLILLETENNITTGITINSNPYPESVNSIPENEAISIYSSAVITELQKNDNISLFALPIDNVDNFEASLFIKRLF